MNVCIVRYNEIALKGRNISNFENLLIKNIKGYLIKENIRFKRIKKSYKRILIYTDNRCSFLGYVFGVASYSCAVEVELGINKIKESALDLVKNVKFKTFRVSSRRANKGFACGSLQLNILIGELIKNKLKKKVNLENFDLDIGIDILDKAYIFINKFKGPGGLPLGIEGNVISLVEDRKSIAASYLAMKRGCKVIPAGYKKFDINLLKKFDYSLKLIILKNIKEIETIAKENNAKALILGQTLESFKETKTKLVILRPLIGFNEKEIEDKLKYLESL